VSASILLACCYYNNTFVLTQHSISRHLLSTSLPGPANLALAIALTEKADGNPNIHFLERQPHFAW